MNTQFKLSKWTSILDLIVHTEFCGKQYSMKVLCTALREIFHIFQDSHYNMGSKSQNKALIKRKVILEPLQAHVTSRYCRRKNCKIQSNLS